MRHTNDNYPTPHSIVQLVIQKLNWPRMISWEPCVGDGRFANAIDAAFGVETLRHDITTGNDFFEWKEAQRPDVITNPPFNCIRQFIDHAFAIGVQRMALVCPERLWACRKGHEQWERHRPTHWINLDWREDYLGKGGSPDRALAVSIWEIPHSENCRYEILGR
jgi:hypothetical protein